MHLKISYILSLGEEGAKSLRGMRKAWRVQNLFSFTAQAVEYDVFVKFFLSTALW